MLLLINILSANLSRFVCKNFVKRLLALSFLSVCLSVSLSLSRSLSFRLSVRPRGTTQLQLNGFSWNLIFEYFSKICRRSSSFTIILIHMDTYVHLWSYLALFFSECEIFQSCRENQNTHFMFSKFIFENRAFYEIVSKKFCSAGQDKHDDVM